jgi:hypothetical protein
MKRSILIELAIAILTTNLALAQQNLSDIPLVRASGTPAPVHRGQITGKQAWIALQEDTLVGDIVLKSGAYQIGHELRGGTHVFTFRMIGDTDLGTFVGQPVSVPCRLETLSAHVKHTRLTRIPDGTRRRLVRIEIRGENVAHSFQP